MRAKHPKDYNNGKGGWVGGNPRHGKAHGNFKGQRAALKRIFCVAAKAVVAERSAA